MAKILLIDDDEQVLKVMTSFLEREHHEVSAAVNGIEGIRHMEAHSFDLIITDVIMPEQDGIGVLIWLMNQANHQKVIAISGGAASLEQSYIFEMCKNLRANKVLSKPVDFETLTSAVREVLEGEVAGA